MLESKNTPTLTFRLIEKCFQDASSYTNNDVDFLIEENDWNDFHYYTSYDLHITRKRIPEAKGAMYLGSIYIMKKGQKIHEKYLLRQALTLRTIKTTHVFEILPPMFFSITFSLDLYKTVSKYLNLEERISFINRLRLILSTDDAFYSQVKNENVFNKSLLRSSTMDSFYLKKGKDLLLMQGIQYNLRKQALRVKFGDSNDEIKLDFSIIKDIDTPAMPNGIITFIGKNGSGKSTALYKLAALLYASPGDRERYLKNIGTILPNDIGISQLLIFSHSPFDNFLLPGENIISDLRSWIINLDNYSGRFIYCGLRNVKEEAEMILASKDKNATNYNTDKIRIPEIQLKPLSSLTQEATQAYERIQSEEKLRNDWIELVSAAELSQHELYQTIRRLKQNTPWTNKNLTFDKLSTGYKFLLHTMLHIIAYCEDDAVLLFDEPENHLQAPLLSFMIAEIRRILYKRNSVMLIATHSPVILQETLSRNVRIVRQEDNKATFVHPSIETFGESFGAIATEVFDLTTDRTQYFNAIDEIYASLSCEKETSAQAAINKIEKAMNGISSQTINYIVQKYMQNKE